MDEVKLCRKRKPFTGKFTPSEREVLALLCEGYSDKGIAEKIFRTDRTVEQILTNIYQKMDLNELPRSTYNKRVLAVLKAKQLIPATEHELLASTEKIVFRARVADTNVDRNYEQLTPGALQQLADGAVGLPVKDDAGNVIGKIIGSEIIPDKE